MQFASTSAKVREVIRKLYDHFPNSSGRCIDHLLVEVLEL